MILAKKGYIRWGTKGYTNSGSFKKGQVPWNKGKKGSQIPWNKGKKLTESQKKNFSSAQKKRFANSHVWNKGKKGLQIPWNKGKTDVYSENTLELIREARLHQVFPAKDTKIEKILQKRLQEKGIKFEKHKPILGQPDIFIKPNICIFADGDYWHANPKFHKLDSLVSSHRRLKHASKIWENDEKINQKLIQKGYNILRFWEHDINENPEKCIRKIIKIIKEARR